MKHLDGSVLSNEKNLDSRVPSNKKHLDGTVPSNMKHLDSNVLSIKKYRDGTEQSNKKHRDGNLICQIKTTQVVIQGHVGLENWYFDWEKTNKLGLSSAKLSQS